MEKYIVKEISCNDNYIYYESLKDDIESNFASDILIGLNKDYHGINSGLLDFIINNLLYYSNYEVETYYKNNIATYIIDEVRKYKKISLKQALSIAKIIKNSDCYYQSEKIKAITDILSVIYCKEYKNTCLRGYCQSDWIYCFYSKDIEYTFIQYIEAVLFATGKEIYISNEKIDINNIDDINSFEYDGYYDYIVDYFLDSDIKEAIAEKIGCDIDDIAFYSIKSIKEITQQIITYNEMK